MKYRYGAALLVSMLFLAPVAHAATGFVDSPLIMSPESPEDGDTVTLSVLFNNSETAAISGTVLFYDQTTLLAQKNLSIQPNAIGIASTSFVITPGIHDFSATMSDITMPGASGTSESVTIPQSTVTLPPDIVTQSVGLGAQADGADAATEAAILGEVNQVQNAVLGVVPASAKSAVSGTVSSVDSWRASTGANFTAARDATQSSIATANKVDAENAARKVGTKPVALPKTADNSASNQAKYYLFAFLAFFFSVPFAFYLGSVIIFYFILRFIVRRIRAGRARRRTASRPQK